MLMKSPGEYFRMFRTSMKMYKEYRQIQFIKQLTAAPDLGAAVF